jgi:prolyl 4-hydroxylase
MQVISYDQTQEYKPHFDTFELKHMKDQEARGGQRTFTALCYLNTPMSGGGTTFPELKRTIDAKQGRMVAFQNTFNGGTIRHPWSLHGGDPVGMGIKWACNIWFRESAFK